MENCATTLQVKREMSISVGRFHSSRDWKDTHLLQWVHITWARRYEKYETEWHIIFRGTNKEQGLCNAHLFFCAFFLIMRPSVGHGQRVYTRSFFNLPSVFQ